MSFHPHFNLLTLGKSHFSVLRDLCVLKTRTVPAPLPSLEETRQKKLGRCQIKILSDFI